MKTPKKPQEVCETSTPSLKTPKNKMKFNTPKSEKQNLQKMVTPKSIKKNKQKGAQSPMLITNNDDVMTHMQQKEGKATNKTPKNKTPKNKIPQNKTPENKTPKNKTPKQPIQNGAKKVESIVSDSAETSLNKSNKNPKKRTIDEVVSSKKKSKVDNQQSQKHEPSNDTSGHMNMTDEVIIEFPPGAKCYKSVLKQIVDMSDQISYPRNLVISFKNEEDAKKNLTLMEKLKVGHQNIIVTQLINNIDPLKKVVNIRPSHGIDPADVHKAVKSSSYSRLVSKIGHQSGLYVFTFASKEEADTAAEKIYDIGGYRIHLRAFFIDANKIEEPIFAETKKRKQDDEKSGASAKKKSKVNAIAKNEVDDEEDEDDDEDDDEENDDDDGDNEEDDDDVGKDGDDDEEGDDDDDDEEGDDDNDDEEGDDDNDDEEGDDDDDEEGDDDDEEDGDDEDE